MSFPFPLTVTVYRVSLNGTDEYGNPQPSAIPSATYTTAADMQPGRTPTEDTTNTDQQSEEWKLYLPSGSPLDGNDRIDWDGQTFEVYGPPSKRYYGSRLDHVAARVRRVV